MQKRNAAYSCPAKPSSWNRATPRARIDSACCRTTWSTKGSRPAPRSRSPRATGRSAFAWKPTPGPGAASPPSPMDSGRCPEKARNRPMPASARTGWRVPTILRGSRSTRCPGRPAFRSRSSRPEIARPDRSQRRKARSPPAFVRLLGAHRTPSDRDARFQGVTLGFGEMKSDRRRDERRRCRISRPRVMRFTEPFPRSGPRADSTSSGRQVSRERCAERRPIGQRSIGAPLPASGRRSERFTRSKP